MYHIKKVVSRQKNAHCSLDTYATYVWKYDATRQAVDFVSSEGLRMVFDDDNIRGSHRYFPNNWPEMKGPVSQAHLERGLGLDFITQITVKPLI